MPRACDIAKMRSGGSYYCSDHEKRTNIYINGTRIPGCIHTDDNTSTLIIVLSVMMPIAAMFIAVILCWACRKSNVCSDPLEKAFNEANAKADDLFVREHLGTHTQDLLVGNITQEVKDIIADARAKHGPLSNNRFEHFVRRHVVKREISDPNWMEKLCFQIRNIQPST